MQSQESPSVIGCDFFFSFLFLVILFFSPTFMYIAFIKTNFSLFLDLWHFHTFFKSLILTIINLLSKK